eukprot:CAMPEP_0176189530 /NCGR_PEP_ID=MMETSP0121_2-20121125/3477_1 /TAXON_ID=160619 /ORGANISM="Kryptoperidinium foliaceum, Strain CCMP 1326" /LENGTH=43 /DNA_ID= /DNA_START= /DNA_END= /DNA_ORIENTATION=
MRPHALNTRRSNGAALRFKCNRRFSETPAQDADERKSATSILT